MTSIPSSLAPFFQEYPLEQLDVREAANTIIERLLQWGNSLEIRWLFHVYPPQRVAAWVKRWGKEILPEPHLTFWRLVLDIPEIS